ncbi:MAG: transposase [Myxococcales bacterium]|nr:transposase [Myxococcales bacterium]
MSVDTWLSRLCGLVPPPPRFHMTRYYGIIANHHHRLRAR